CLLTSSVDMFAYYTMFLTCSSSIFFFFNDPATPDIYTLSLHDALPIFLTLDDDFAQRDADAIADAIGLRRAMIRLGRLLDFVSRSEEHTSELQSRVDLVCRLLLEKKKKKKKKLNKQIRITVSYLQSQQS